MGWGVADQGMSSLTNFAVNIYIARELGAVEYGAFALAFVTYAFALNASRGLATDPLLVRFSATDLPTWRRAVASSSGTAAVTGVVTGMIVLAVTPLLGGSTRMAFLALGLTLPGLLLQDSWRFAFFAHGRGALALLNDTVWAIALVAGLAILRVTGHETVFWLVFVWGASAGLRRGARRVPGGSHTQGCRDSPMAGDALGPRASVPGRGHAATAPRRSWSPTGSACCSGWPRWAPCRPPAF